MKGQRWLLVLDEAISPCVDPSAVIEIGSANRNRWLLFPGTAWQADCHAAVTATDTAQDEED